MKHILVVDDVERELTDEFVESQEWQILINKRINDANNAISEMMSKIIEKSILNHGEEKSL